jgi:hypothetical protein
MTPEITIMVITAQFAMIFKILANLRLPGAMPGEDSL